MSKYSPIKTLEFLSQDEAIAIAKSFNYGILKKETIGVSIVKLGDYLEPTRDTVDDIYFSSKTDDAFFNYTIEKHEKKYVLHVYKTKKHEMISAAISGNLISFKENFDHRDKMIQFSLSSAIENDNWDIVEYLIDNYDFKDKPIWLAIRYDKLNIVKRLLSKGMILPNDWLAYCMYSNSLNVIKELLEIKKVHQRYTSDELKTNWFFREVKKDSLIAKYVKEILL